MIREERIFSNNDLQIRLFNGLSQKEAEQRLKRYGPNELTKTKKISVLSLFLDQFKDFITMVLLAATLISYFLGEIADAVTIVIIIVMNAFLGFIQEYRAEKSMEALTDLSAPHASVLRDSSVKNIPAREVVPGDIIILETGSRVPADCALIEAVNVQADESILTGESVPVEKIPIKTNQIAETITKEHKLFMGTTLTMGRGKAIVLKTGMQTEMGGIADLLQNVDKEPTPLQKRLDRIGRELVLICLGVCALITVAGIYHGEPVYNMFLFGVSLAVAAIPEGLPAIVTVSLAIGVQRMLKRNVLIRKLSAVETLGSINVICSDKTGTLTENKMTVKKIFAGDTMIDVTGSGYDIKGGFLTDKGPINPNNYTPLQTLLMIGALCNNAEYKNGEISGDPTDAAVLIASKKAGIDQKTAGHFARIAEIPFDSDRKRMSVIYKERNGYYLLVKGAPDKIINICAQKLDASGVSMLTGTQKRTLLNINDRLAGQALRVLAFAYKKIDFSPKSKLSPAIEENLIFVGLEGMIDPPKAEAIKSIKNCYGAGIKPVIITGDHKNTAMAIARELGMNAKENNVLTGDQIEEMSDKDLENKVSDITVFARVTPKHKLKIVRAYKSRRNIVAMTGDGVNDAPALKEANIGIAMGKSGTDVAKEASEMVLLDDNFSTIVNAIEEGRIIYDNIRKFIRYLLSCNLGEILMMAAAAFWGMPIPLVPIQILWVNLVTDGLPALALGVEPPDKGIMNRPPRKGDEGIFSRGLGTSIALSGFLIGASSLAAFMVMLYTSGGNIAKARTVAFITLVIAELIYSFESKSETSNIFEVGFFSNPYLILANLASLVLTIAVIYIPFLSAIFKTYALGYGDWFVVVLFSIIEFTINSLIL
ncbi:cation-translocating P-type ATPase [Mahella sp.]|jgi:Ca2+-transporting ATPase|uniref:cation-translocating P-type ATPase n=1 Tax=Mahella sp. TaxID=2798721 RepID=UPI0024AB8D3C|nr:cation-translocating P-type ATPase [Mahella sp.]MBZ4666480.1 ATPase, P-type (transporting), superfamily, subfamily [Mahella sp.]MDI3508341.1 P-type Ca2+ transporter type [Clostridiales bacterium]MDK2902623.1 P-type Ca2+ transporter type [Clostridiales bacterium]